MLIIPKIMLLFWQKSEAIMIINDQNKHYLHACLTSL